MDDETDELTPLSEYAARAIERANNGKPKDNIMCVIDEACSACVQIPASVAASATKAVLITQSFIFLFLAKNLVLSKRSAKMNTV